MKSFEIIWSSHAENELDSIFNYYSEFASVRVAKKLIQDILAEPNKLLLNPEISQREELLLDRENEYRYLVCKNYKIIYRYKRLGRNKLSLSNDRAQYF